MTCDVMTRPVGTLVTLSRCPHHPVTWHNPSSAAAWYQIKDQKITLFITKRIMLEKLFCWYSSLSMLVKSWDGELFILFILCYLNWLDCTPNLLPGACSAHIPSQAASFLCLVGVLPPSLSPRFGRRPQFSFTSWQWWPTVGLWRGDHRRNFQ